MISNIFIIFIMKV